MLKKGLCQFSIPRVGQFCSSKLWGSKHCKGEGTASTKPLPLFPTGSHTARKWAHRGFVLSMESQLFCLCWQQTQWFISGKISSGRLQTGIPYDPASWVWQSPHSPQQHQGHSFHLETVALTWSLLQHCRQQAPSSTTPKPHYTKHEQQQNKASLAAPSSSSLSSILHPLVCIASYSFGGMKSQPGCFSDSIKKKVCWKYDRICHECILWGRLLDTKDFGNSSSRTLINFSDWWILPAELHLPFCYRILLPTEITATAWSHNCCLRWFSKSFRQIHGGKI